MLRMMTIACAFWALSFSADASAACMSKTIEGDVASEPSRPNFQRAAPRSKATIIVADSDTGGFAQKGFVAEACPTTEKEKLKLARDVCATAAFGNEAVQARFTSVLGAIPKNLCEAATRAVGPSAMLDAEAVPAPVQQKP